MRKSNKLVHGIGFKGMDYPACENGENTREYAVWHKMLERCTKKLWDKRPTYTGTTCSENFKHYSYFYEWCQQQIGFGNTDEHRRYWHLDKDLLSKGNKAYSENTCVFLPHRLNCLLIKSDASRGDFPLGVSWSKAAQKYVAQCGEGKKDKSTYIGVYNTVEEAFLVYKTYKEQLIKEVANEYCAQLDPRAYQALLNYTVEITD